MDRPATARMLGRRSMKIKRLGNAYCAVRIGTPPGDLLPVSETTFTAYLHSALKIQDQMLVVTIAAICRGRTGAGFLASTPARTLSCGSLLQIGPGNFELIDKIQTPADSHHRVLVLSNRDLNQSTIF
jgi:hypothetical protein